MMYKLKEKVVEFCMNMRCRFPMTNIVYREIRFLSWYVSSCTLYIL